MPDNIIKINQRGMQHLLKGKGGGVQKHLQDVAEAVQAAAESYARDIQNPFSGGNISGGTYGGEALEDSVKIRQYSDTAWTVGVYQKKGIAVMLGTDEHPIRSRTGYKKWRYYSNQQQRFKVTQRKLIKLTHPGIAQFPSGNNKGVQPYLKKGFDDVFRALENGSFRKHNFT